MNRKLMLIIFIPIFVALISFGVYLLLKKDQPLLFTLKTENTKPAEENKNSTTLSNPASTNCVEKGGTLEIRDEAAGQVGYCKFSDGSECEEWAYLKNECTVGQSLKKDKSVKPIEVVIEEPVANAVITSPLIVKGTAPGNWFFEANAQIELRDANGIVIAKSFVTAKGDWMTEKPVAFEGKINFNTPSTVDGVLVFKNDNPSGLPENSKSFEVPVKFNPNQKLTIKVFFPNKIKNPGMLDCSKVYAVERQILPTQAVGQAALTELLKGPTEAEKQDGYFTSINSGTKLNNLKIENGKAYADFDARLNENIGGSCLVTSIRSQITETLKQFPTVNEVIISSNGNVEGILQP